MIDITVEEEKALRDILKNAKTIAVVGASTVPYRDSNMIAKFLISKGYEVIPVNPKYDEVLERKCYPSVQSVGKQIDIVDVFRRSEYLEDVARDAVSAKARVLWMQLGVENEDAGRYAAENGLQVVMNRCIMVEHRRLIR